VLLVFVVLTATGIALLATRFIVALVATRLAMFLAAVVPNGVSEYIKNLNGRRRVVTLDDQLTSS
jgi:hypothetical protein